MRHRPYATVVMLSLGLAACSGGSASDTGSSAPSASMTYFSGSASPTGSASSPVAPSSSTTRATTGTTTTATPSMAGSATSSVVMPDMPAAAKAHTPEGAAAFARYYIELVNYAWQKPDPAPLRAHALPSCQTCQNWALSAADYLKTGRRPDIPPLTIKASDPGDQLPTGEQTVITVIQENAYREVGGGKAASKPNKSSRYPLALAAKWTSGGWRVVAIEDVQR